MEENEGVKKIHRLELNTYYTYEKSRFNFGRWCSFQDQSTEININISPDLKLSKLFSDVEHVDRGTMAIVPMSWKEANTSYIKSTDTGIDHVEGGWPKDISYLDEQQTTRYHKKAKREESYVPTMTNLCELMEACINQNNSLDIYQDYFVNEPPIEQHNEITSHVFANLWDHSGQNRSVSCLSWHPLDGMERLAAGHCDLDYSEYLKPCTDSYIWRIENSFEPELILTPTSPMLTMEYNYKDVFLLAGGQYNGQVTFFDIRKSNKPVGLTNKKKSHLEPVNSLQWMQSKTGFECFTTSSDAQVLWWDMRNLQEYVDHMVIDPTKQNSLKNAEGGVVLEYTTTAPTKFMVGTEQGNIYSCTRKAKNPGEKMGQVFAEHFGPIYLLQRNNHLVKSFLTVGDYHADIWCEDFPHAPVWKTPMHNTHILHGSWSPSRPSMFYLCTADGFVEVWDLMSDQKIPEYTVKLSKDRLYCMSIEEKGEFVAVGSETGKSFIMKMTSEAYELQHNEKTFFLNMMDRESRREKFIMDKEKENKVIRTNTSHYINVLTAKEKEEMEELVAKVTEDFYYIINEEKKKFDKFKKRDVMLETDIIRNTLEEEEEEEEEEKEEYNAEMQVVVKMPEDLNLPMYRESVPTFEGKADAPDELSLTNKVDRVECDKNAVDCTTILTLPSKADCLENYEKASFKNHNQLPFDPKLVEERKDEMKTLLAQMFANGLEELENGKKSELAQTSEKVKISTAKNVTPPGSFLFETVKKASLKVQSQEVETKPIEKKERTIKKEKFQTKIDPSEPTNVSANKNLENGAEELISEAPKVLFKKKQTEENGQNTEKNLKKNKKVKKQEEEEEEEEEEENKDEEDDNIDDELDTGEGLNPSLLGNSHIVVPYIDFNDNVTTMGAEKNDDVFGLKAFTNIEKFMHVQLENMLANMDEETEEEGLERLEVAENKKKTQNDSEAREEDVKNNERTTAEMDVDPESKKNVQERPDKQVTQDLSMEIKREEEGLEDDEGTTVKDEVIAYGVSKTNDVGKNYGVDSVGDNEEGGGDDGEVGGDDGEGGEDEPALA